MANLVSDGSYLARAVTLKWTKSKHKGTLGATIVFRITGDGPFKGRELEETFYLTDQTREKAAQFLALCGYDGDNDESVQRNEVQIDVEQEQYNPDPTKPPIVRARVQWVSEPGRTRAIHTPMEETEKLSAKAALKGLVLQKQQEIAKAAAAPKDTGTSFPFGANAPAAGPPPGKPMF
jgi:hypothetical protein